MTIKLWIASDTTHGAAYTTETDSLDILDIAYKYGRAESGETVSITEIDGVPTDILNRPSAYWDGQHKAYKVIR